MIDGIEYDISGKILRRLIDNPSAPLLANLVCATYWGGAVNLHELESLDDDNWRLAVEIMGYRRSFDWSDMEFCALTLYCRGEYDLTAWVNAKPDDSGFAPNIYPPLKLVFSA